jgi:hypothetical protein
MLTTSKLLVFYIEQQGSGGTIFGIHERIGFRVAGDIPYFDGHKVVGHFVASDTGQGNGFRYFSSKWISRVGKDELAIDKTPGGVVRQRLYFAEDQFAQLGHVEGGHISTLISVGSDEFVGRSQEISAFQVFCDAV